MARLAIGDDAFLLDGKVHQIISGALHYFRIHPDSWQDRIRKAKQLGLNTIETYVAWNYHAPTQGEFHTTDHRDLGRFLDLIAAEGMHAIVRPGPYICAEWDNGGLPTWLTSIPGIALRTSDPQYLAHVQTYLEHLAPILTPRQIDQGGPIILFQVENEYGAYGSDKDYLAWLVDSYQRCGFTVPFTTVDQPQPQMLTNGMLPGVLATGSFGSRATERFATLREFQPTGPLMCSEFWIGWFDSWGEHHHTTSTADAAATLDEMLAMGASVNIYMFHGGTNYGFTSGANDKGVYKPITTSYDYDALLAEDGSPTAKYWAFREVISKYTSLGDAPAQREPSPAFGVELPMRTHLFPGAEGTAAQEPSSTQLGAGLLGEPLRTLEPAAFEDFSQEVALALYTHDLASPDHDRPRVLQLHEVRDAARVYLNGIYYGTLNRDHHDKFLTLPAGSAGELAILVESQGRVNYGPRLGELKGLGAVSIDGGSLQRWACFPLEFSGLDDADYAYTEPFLPVPGATLVRGSWQDKATHNLYFSTEGWGKGVVWVNGFNLGRYWSRGPAKTLFIPAELLVAGTNTITVLELNGAAAARAQFVAEPNLGHTEA